MDPVRVSEPLPVPSAPFPVPAGDGASAEPLKERPSPPLPPAPAFGHRSLAEVLTSAAASLGIPGFENRLNLPAGKRVCVVLADGLGRNLLKQKSAHTPFL
ncbi:MAG TPA: alkaline phosphatase family protein, partial [Arthrobacter sp.]|nr:alkaline phosphatase family protein [Arthrobacter sp.]